METGLQLGDVRLAHAHLSGWTGASASNDETVVAVCIVLDSRVDSCFVLCSAVAPVNSSDLAPEELSNCCVLVVRIQEDGDTDVLYSVCPPTDFLVAYSTGN